MQKIINSFRAFYSPSFPKLITYMLQSVEYRPGPYLAWFWRTQDFSNVKVRKELDQTKAAKLILKVLNIGILAQLLIGLIFIYLSLFDHYVGYWGFGLAIIIAYPVLWSQVICLPLIAGRLLITGPREKKLIKDSSRIFANHKGLKIAVAGSYGKTSMKELLLSVLAQGKDLAATPANKNVASSHANFARTLSGKEDILIIELGEGAPGDVAKFAATIRPDMAIITGLAAAHLDRYKTIEAAGKDIFSLYAVLDKSKIMVNRESPDAAAFIKPDYQTYDRSGALGWKVEKITSDIRGLKFNLKKDKKVLKISSGLIGRHEIGPLSLVAALASRLGLSEKQIVKGIAQAKPYEHRMQPYELNGAWVIDDTYNGNIEGIRAGLSLLSELSARHKIYVSPGLVDQGQETKPVHKLMGELIAQANPDTVVLMQNSVTGYISEGLKKANFKGRLQIETEPLIFYNNLANFVAAGDVVLMQNDWTDNYR